MEKIKIMKVKELKNTLEDIFYILGDDELFGDMLEHGEFEFHSNHSKNGGYECQLCYLNLPKGKLTINDLLYSYEEIKDFKIGFERNIEDYLQGI